MIQFATPFHPLKNLEEHHFPYDLFGGLEHLDYIWIMKFHSLGRSSSSQLTSSQPMDFSEG